MIERKFTLSANETLTVSIEEDGRAFGNYNHTNGDFSCLNNYDNFGHGPGIEKPFPHTPAGLVSAAQYFDAMRRRMDALRQAAIAKQRQAEYEARKAKREAREARRAQLRGGMKKRQPVAGLTLGC